MKPLTPWWTKNSCENGQTPYAFLGLGSWRFLNHLWTQETAGRSLLVFPGSTGIEKPRFCFDCGLYRVLISSIVLHNVKETYIVSENLTFRCYCVWNYVRALCEIVKDFLVIFLWQLGGHINVVSSGNDTSVGITLEAYVPQH